MTLTTYRKKRHFAKTPEPKGKHISQGKQLCFVVQKHAASHLHYDFRLEMEGVLKSWAVPKGPSMNPADKHLAVMVEDHPYAYRKFKGTIPKGNYGAGTVAIWDEGTYAPAAPGKNAETVLLEELKKGDLKIILHGKKLKGEFALVRMGKDEDNWLLIKKADTYQTEENILKEEIPASVLRKILMKGKKISIPHEVKPMLANLAKNPFNDPAWLYELKWDGYRALSEIHKGKIRLYSRNKQEYNIVFQEIVTALERISNDVVLDGEIVAFDKNGKSSFQFIQDYRKTPQGITLVYYVFDLLYIDGYDIRDLPLIERKTILKEILLENTLLKYSDHIENYGLQLFELAKVKNMEGIIAKKKDSKYVPTRSSEWLKIKHIQMQEAVICGFTQPSGHRKYFGALILGIYENSELRYAGHTGGGFDDDKLKEITTLLKPLTTTASPFQVTPPTNTPATWVQPKLVCQIKFSEWTRDGLMRQPIFLGLREDKKPEEVTQETLQANTKISGKKTFPKKQKIQLTNLTKIFWPRETYTKGDLIKYYERIAPVILPYLKDRPESLLRHPDGITCVGFFQKDMSQAPPWVKTIQLFSESEKKTIHWLLCNDQNTLLYMANLGCIEINPWSSRYHKKDYPDYLIIDLDPNDIPFAEVVHTAQYIKKLMDQVEIEAFIKTSGKTGLHILVPLGAKYTFHQTRQFAEILANTVSQELPHTTSVVRDPKKREKKVYIDFLQNRIGQTLAAPYSIRPVPHAPVSTPLRWDELNNTFHPTDFTIKNIFKRLDKHQDIWKGFLHHKGINMLKSLDLLMKAFRA